MNDNEINELVETLKEKGYFREFVRNIEGNVKIYNNNGGFHEIRKDELAGQLINKSYLSKKDAIEYWYAIYKKLPVFPTKQHINYDKYLEICNKETLDSVVKIFLDTPYKKNELKKREVESLSLNDKSNYIQVLINNDVFITPNRQLYKYDVDNKTFILVNEDNIEEIINCNDKAIAERVLNRGRQTIELIQIYDMVSRFEQARHNDELKKNYRDDYVYIVNLFETFKT